MAKGRKAAAVHSPTVCRQRAGAAAFPRPGREPRARLLLPLPPPPKDSHPPTPPRGALRSPQSSPRTTALPGKPQALVQLAGRCH